MSVTGAVAFGWSRRGVAASVAALAMVVSGNGGRAARAESKARGAVLAAWGGGTPAVDDVAPATEGAPSEARSEGATLSAGMVGIVGAMTADPLLTETAARIQLELGAAAIASQFLSCAHTAAQETEACGSSRSRARGATVEAAQSDTTVLSLSRRSRAVIIEVVASMANGAKVLRLVHVPIGKGGEDAGVLAIRAVELLRDVRLEVARDRLDRTVPLPPPPAHSPPPPTLTAPAVVAAVEDRQEPLAAPAPAESPLVVAAQPPAPPPIVRWSLGVAVSTLIAGTGFRGYAPLLFVEASRGPHLSVDLSAAGPFFERLNARTVDGSIDTRQEFATLGARWRWDFGWIRPYLGVAAGLYHLRLQSTPLDPPAWIGNASHSFWAPVVVPRAGLTVPITTRVAATLEYGLLFTGPSAEIVIASEMLGRVGGPSTLLQLAVAATLP